MQPVSSKTIARDVLEDVAKSIWQYLHSDADKQHQDTSSSVDEHAFTIQQDTSSSDDEHSVTRTKTYVYKYDNGKSKVIKRIWTNKGHNAAKREQLAQFFNEHEDELKACDKSIKTLYNEYNDKHDLKVSYSMFYKHFTTKFAK
jgi:ABC-type Zn2+ transport system substrate-binding protein/surface adhesin